MADKKISALTAATTPLDGTEVLPIVQSGATVKVQNNDLRPKQIQSNATSGVLQITGPAASTTRVMTTPNANFTAARTDAGQTFTGTQTVLAAATQDAVALAGRAGGSGSYVATISPTTLSASRTITLPNADTTVPVATQVLTFSGPTAARTITLPDANFTAARTDAAQSFTGDQTLSTGNLIVGTSGKGIDTSGAIPTVFSINGSERGRFSASGYFKASSDGTYVSATGSNHEFRNTADTDSVVFTATDATYTSDVLRMPITRAASTAYNMINCLANSVGQFRVRGDGTIYAQNTTVQSISDIRTKQNIRNSEDGLSIIQNLRPIRFDYKPGFGNDRINQLGFIAQEIEQVFPDAVDVWGESDDPNSPYKSVGQAALIPVLVKAIQELKTELDQVKTALGSK